jgi:hypothetical protein
METEYTVVRNGVEVTIPAEELTPEEARALARQYERDAEKCRREAEAIERYVARRQRNPRSTADKKNESGTPRGNEEPDADIQSDDGDELADAIQNHLEASGGETVEIPRKDGVVAITASARAKGSPLFDWMKNSLGE